jgi:hypothetical protein
MKENVTLPSVDDWVLEQLLCSVQVCVHDPLIMRTVSVLLNCPSTVLYCIVYRLCLFISSIFFQMGSLLQCIVLVLI